MVSEIARIKQNIAAEYIAAQWGLTGLASGTAQHRIITARMERIQHYHTELQTVVGDEAIKLVADLLDHLPETLTRSGVLDILRYELGENEETAILLDWIQDAWKTHDRLIERFGEDTAWKILRAPSSLTSDEEQPS